MSVRAANAQARDFTIFWDVNIGPIPLGAGTVDVFLPLPVDNARQKVLKTTIESQFSGKQDSEKKWGNAFWHGHLDQSLGETISVKGSVQIALQTVPPPDFSKLPATPLSAAEKEEWAPFLQAERFFPQNVEPLDSTAKQITPREKSPTKIARAIFEFLLADFSYAEELGRGDAIRALVAKSGDAADLSTLFVALSRAKGIPARFVSGVVLQTAGPAADGLPGHFWAEIYLSGAGWVPVDVASALQIPARKHEFFGGLKSGAIQLSTGRGLALGDGQRDAPLNMFLKPYAEVHGKKYDLVVGKYTVRAGKVLRPDEKFDPRKPMLPPNLRH